MQKLFLVFKSVFLKRKMKPQQLNKQKVDLSELEYIYETPLLTVSINMNYSIPTFWLSR